MTEKTMSVEAALSLSEPHGKYVEAQSGLSSVEGVGKNMVVPSFPMQHHEKES